MKWYYKSLILIGNIIFLFSCQSISTIVGIHQDVSHRFIFNADSTFQYFYMAGTSVDRYSSGKWKATNKNKIVLNSNIQSKILPLKIDIIPSENELNNFRVNLFIQGGNEKAYRAYPFVNANLFFNFTPDRGSYNFDTGSFINKISFKVSKEPMVIERLGAPKEYYLLETEKKDINLNKGDSVIINIEVADSLFSYKIFKNEIIKFNGNKMIFKDKTKASEFYLFP